jgi:ferredoxin
VQSFCTTCELCAEHCPIGAIPRGDKSEYNGIKKWKLDEAMCFRYWYAVGTDCALCMAACPWTKPRTWFHRSLAWLATVKGPHQSWMVQADRLFYDRRGPAPRPGFLEPAETKRPGSAEVEQ